MQLVARAVLALLLAAPACAAPGPNPFGEATAAVATDMSGDSAGSDVETSSGGSSSSGDPEQPGCPASTVCETRPFTSLEAWYDFDNCACAEGNLVLDNFRREDAAGGTSVLLELYGNLTVMNCIDDLGEIFPQLLRVEGNVRFSNIAFDGPLHILQHITVAHGDLVLDNVSHVDALAHMVGVEGDFHVVGGAPDLDELSYLRSVDGVFGLGTDQQRLPPALESVGGLWVHEGHSPTLTFVRPLAIENDLVIDFDYGLTAFAGLEHIASVGGNVRVEDNPMLPDCESVRLVEALGSIGFAGELSVCRNLADACSAQLPPCG